MSLDLHVILLIPLVGAVAVAALGRSPNVREAATLVTGGVLFAAVLSRLPGVMNGERPSVELFEMFPGIPIALELEPLGMLFALVASGLWIVTSIYAIGYMRGHHEENQTRFYASFAVSIFGALGVAFAGNMLTLFLFYEVLTLSTYPLVSHHGTEKAMKGARAYLSILLSTSIGLLLLAVAWTWMLAGTLDFEPGGILAGQASDGVLTVLLALYAFGTGKAALMPFHRWLPSAMVAPTPVSALLHAVAVVKAGVFTVLKVVVYVFGLDLLGTTGISTWLMWVAAITILVASLVAMAQDNLKRRLAYSTVSQLSYIVLGAALANASGVIGGGMHIAMHAVGQDHALLLRGGHLRGRDPQDRDQRHAWARPHDADHHARVSRRGAERHRGAPARRQLEQVVSGARRGRRRADDLRRGADDQLASEHRVPGPDSDPSVLLESRRRVGARALQRGPRLLRRGALVHRARVHRPVLFRG